MVLKNAGTDKQIGYADIAYLERSAEHYRQFGKNFLTTVVIGAGAAGAIWAIVWSPCEDVGFMACFLEPESRGEAFVMGSIIGGAVAVPVGLILGLTLQYDRWEPLSVPGLPAIPSSTISIKPVFTGGLGAVASFSF
jgi:hypothetical protein